jgi:hypothetical protein
VYKPKGKSESTQRGLVRAAVGSYYVTCRTLNAPYTVLLATTQGDVEGGFRQQR